jgi:hypothetical protein
MNTRISLAVVIMAVLITAAGCDKRSGVGAADYQDYGAGIQSTTALTSIRAILEDPFKYDGKPVTVKGIIASVCPSSGCFLRLGEGTSQIYVDLKKGGFTIPRGKNVGHLAYVSGVANARSDEIKIDATGVRILEK